MTITKEDFVATHALSKQVEAVKLAPAIADSWLLDVRPRLRPGLLEQVQALPAFVVETWPVVLADVLPGQYVERRERVYKALLPSPDPLEQDVPTDSISTLAWEYDPLRTLWHVFLKPFWKQAAWCRFLPSHGVNMDKAGVVEPADPAATFRPLSSGSRASLQVAADTTAEALLSRLLGYVRAHHTTTTQTCGNAGIVRRKRIRGI